MNKFIKTDEKTNTPIALDATGKQRESFWRTGKKEMKKYLGIKLKFTTNAVSLVFGTIFGIVILLPIALVAYQIFDIYSDFVIKINGSIMVSSVLAIFLSIVVVLLMVANGLMNVITIKIAQSIIPEMANLQELKVKEIFLYQILNPIYFLVIFIAAVFFFVGTIGR
jgi:hypothetical protein